MPYMEQVTVPAPLKQEPNPRKPLIQVMLMVGIPILMVVMIIVMVTVGGRNNPMMFMMMAVMMLSMVAGMFMNFTGGGQGDINQDRQNYFLALKKNREKAHAVGRTLHRIQTFLFPNPDTLLNRVRNRDETIWTASPITDDDADKGSAELLDTSENSSKEADLSSAYMRARVGSGMMSLTPRIEVERSESVAPEQLEPVTFLALNNFMATQNIVPNVPLSVSLDGMPAVGMRGHVPYRYDLTRGMVMSLAYNHSPDVLMLGVVSADDDVDDEWDWIKWLPHNLNTFAEPDAAGYRALRWSSFADCCRDLAENQAVLRQDNARIVVIVDLPDANLTYPGDIANLPRTTFLIVNARDDKAVTSIEHRFHISGDFDSDRMFSVAGQDNLAKVDVVPRYKAVDFAHAMAPLRPRNFGHRVLHTTSEEAVVRKEPHMLEAIGATDLERFDVIEQWRKTDAEKSFKTPLGFGVHKNASGGTYTPNGQIVYLDMTQIASGGSGPHGAFQGATGSGKSFLISTYIALLCALHSPKKLVIIAMDFKGGATFNLLARLPHFQANLTNMEDSLDMVDRARDVVQGEIERRQEIFRDLGGLEDIYDYRKLQRAEPERNLPDMPNVLMVADEFREFLQHNPGYKSMFNSIAAVGRSVGVHLLLGSQYIDDMLIPTQDRTNYHYGISLKAAQAAHSQAVVRTARATDLPQSKVGILWHNDGGDERHTYFQGFNRSLPYVPRRAVEDRRVEAERNIVDANLAEFTQRSFADRAVVSEEDSTVDEDTFTMTPDVSTGKDEFEALLETIQDQGRDYADVYRMWATPISEPMTMAHLSESDLRAPEDMNPGSIRIRLGDVDIPIKHKRVPLEVDFTPSKGNVMITGDQGTGRSTAIKALVASSAMRYSGREVSWMLYDFAGSALSAMENYPNVAAYAMRGDEDIWHRIQGEVSRVIAIRSRVFTEQRLSSMDDYFRYREQIGGIPGDEHGYIVLAVDGLQQMFESNDVKFDENVVAPWVERLTRGPQLGVFTVGTATDFTRMFVRVRDNFSTGIRLRSGDNGATFQPPSGTPEFRVIMQRVPANDPGRIVDDTQRTATGQTLYHHGRILLPIADPVEWTERAGVRTFNVRRDFSSQIIELGNHINTLPIARNAAEKLGVADVRTSLREVFDLTAPLAGEMKALPVKDRPLVYGLDTGTLLPAVLNPSKDIQPAYGFNLPGMRHVLVAGEARSGKTTSLRTFMESVSATYSPDEARFMILDGTGGLIDASRKYIDAGYMQAQNYAMDKNQAEVVMGRVGQVIALNTPNPDEIQADPTIVESRQYVKTPELFVFVDNIQSFMSANQYSPGALETTMMSLPQQDVGVRFIFTHGANSKLMQNLINNKGIAHLSDTLESLYVFMLSGPGSLGQIVQMSRSKFRSMPPGRAQVFHRSHSVGSTLPVVQFGLPSD